MEKGAWFQSSLHISAGHPALIKEIQNDLVEDILVGNSLGSIPEFTDEGVSGRSVSLAWGADKFTHIRAFPFGFRATNKGLTV